jgi:hypothetical protein
MELRGGVVDTIVRGNIVIHNGMFTGTSFRGELQKRGKPIIVDTVIK